jgi:Cytochrome bd terminal oxidase subunit I
MEWIALLLFRVQFAFTVSFHIVSPSFTIGLAAWLTVLEARHLATGKTVYRRLFEFWLKIFGVRKSPRIHEISSVLSARRRLHPADPRGCDRRCTMGCACHSVEGEIRH